MGKSWSVKNDNRYALPLSRKSRLTYTKTNLPPVGRRRGRTNKDRVIFSLVSTYMRSKHCIAFKLYGSYDMHSTYNQRLIFFLLFSTTYILRPSVCIVFCFFPLPTSIGNWNVTMRRTCISNIYFEMKWDCFLDVHKISLVSDSPQSMKCHHGNHWNVIVKMK
jgi:hypothetical protein